MNSRRTSTGAAFLQGDEPTDEAFYRAAAAHLYDIVTVTDRHGIIIFMGGAAGAILGGRPHERLARRLVDISHPDDRRQVEEHIALLARSAAASALPPLEHRLLAAGGTYRWIESVTRNLLDDPAVNGLVFIGRDVTARVQAEAALRDSQIRLDTTMWATQIGFWELNLDTDRTTWLNNWCEALGIDPCDGSDHVDRWDARIHPDDLEAARGAFSNHIAGVNSFYEAEYRVLDRSGSWRWIRERGRVVERNYMGRARRMIGTCMDINVRRAAEDALRGSQAALQALAASVPECLLQLDPSLKVIWASRALGGMSMGDLVGLAFTELVDEGERVALAQTMKRVLEEQQTAEFALRVGGPSCPALRARATPVIVGNQSTGLVVSLAPPR
jgi:PAS domain S-box-containing protein